MKQNKAVPIEQRWKDDRSFIIEAPKGEDDGTGPEAARESQADTNDAPTSNTQEASSDVPDIQRSVGVLVAKDGKILCGVRAEGSNTGLICGPGGHVKQGESYEQAAFRETEEEFGISPRALLPLGFGPKESDTGMAPAIFLCTDYDGEPYSNDREMALPCFCSMSELETLSGAGMLFQPFKDGLNVMTRCLETGNPNISEKTLDKSAQSVKITSQETSEDGGPGSGNFGHKGVPGRVGGSSSGGSRFQNSDYEKALTGLTTSDGKIVKSIDPHLFKRAKQRRIYPNSISAALSKGTVTAGNVAGRSVYSHCGTTVVLVDDEGLVKTAIYKGKKAKKGG